MLAFEPARTLHGTAIPHEANQKCQRIGSALSLQSNALKRAITAHADIKAQQALVQTQQLELVKLRTQLGSRKNGQPKTPPAAQQSELPAAKRPKA